MIEWRRRPLFYAALLLCGAIAAWHFFHLPEFLPANDISHELKAEERSVFLGGKIVSEVEARPRPFGGETMAFILDTGKLWEGFGDGGKAVKGRVRVSWADPPGHLSYGDIIVLEGRLAAFKGVRNPGGFDARAYWQRQNVRAAFYADKKPLCQILARGKGNILKASAIQWKRALSKKLSRDFPVRDAAFLKALFLGEKSDLDQDFKDLFLKTGTMHILAVSGFNIGFLSAILWLFMKPFPLSRPVKLVLTLGVIWIYCLLVGWQAPVVRASVMATVMVLAGLTGRRADGLNSLGLAALVVLAWNPRQLFDAGFQLSFLAVFGLITLAPVFIERPKLLPNERWTWKERAVFSVKELFWVSFICYVLTLPVVLQNFYIVTPYSLIANLVVVPVSFLLFLFGAVYFVLPWTAPIRACVLLLVKALGAVESLPGAVFVVGRLEPWLWSGLAAGIFYLFFEKRFQSAKLRAAALVLFCLNIFAAQEVFREMTRKSQMTMLDVGQGDAAYFEFAKGGNLLVDAGGARFSDKGRWAVLPFLRAKGVRALDAVVISHPQEDHIGGLPTLIEELKIRNVIDSGRPYRSELWQSTHRRLVEEGAKEWTASRGDSIEGVPGVALPVLHPVKDAAPDKNINNDCVVFKVVEGGHSVLMTGDIEEPAMQSMLDAGQNVQAEVLKVPHHGAKLNAVGTAFVQAVSPKVSLISAGERNPFGHPHARTLAVLDSVPGNETLRTDQGGAIRRVL